ncbi:MAG: metallophosphoesterase family protein [Anaerolineales bacterium]|nr:metallophosphoesterase family protein [Anaerolineales bacterium]
MSTSKRLTEVFRSAEEIPFDDSSKFVLFSDCHRGDNSWSDDLAHNQILLWHALKRYYEDGFTYIEVGDGDELWENKKFEDIRKAHSHLYWQMRQFHQENRLYLIWGNHNADWKEPKNVEKHLYGFHNERTGENEPLFDGLTAHEGLVLRHSDTGNSIFVVHGHQGDLLSDRLWRLSRFFVRYIWKPLQMLGIKDPTSPAKNFKKRREVEQKIIGWIEAAVAPNDNQMIICGHTHRPMFPQVGEPLYFNIGSCVHPRCITGIEIQGGKIELIKWWVKPDDESGMLRVTKETKMGPKRLQDFL